MTVQKLAKLIEEASRNKSNRVYYTKCFNINDTRLAGINQCKEISQLDRIVIEKNKNECIQYYGMNIDGSYFKLIIKVFSLYPNNNYFYSKLSEHVDEHDGEELKWRLGEVKFVYFDNSTSFEYSYEHKQLIDYDRKRMNCNLNESKNIIKIGSLSLETVLPFSLSRILFNGLMRKRRIRRLSLGDESSKDTVDDLISIRLTISTHPTCDKFDYKFRFDEKYLLKTIEKELLLTNNNTNVTTTEIQQKQLLNSMLEDRIDQSFMFEGKLEELVDSSKSFKFTMWGTKVKKFFNPFEAKNEQLSRENLYILDESGTQINLVRPKNNLNLLYGMINNCFDYASCIYDSKLDKLDSNKSPNSTSTNIEFKELTTFDQLTSSSSHSNHNNSNNGNNINNINEEKLNYKITLRGFVKKDYEIQFETNDLSSSAEVDRNFFFKIKLNNFDGFCYYQESLNLYEDFLEAQKILWTCQIRDDMEFSFKLANESLLGGKGNSLIELNKLIDNISLNKNVFATITPHELVNVSVPAGLVVSSQAYSLWLHSDERILKSIKKLDNLRRAMSARSIYTNPMSNMHYSIVKSQQLLREQCKETCELLKSCPLPKVLVEYIYERLVMIFKPNEINVMPESSSSSSSSSNDVNNEKRKLFAIRSSAIGEDSMETSAAGQMKTILGSCGLDSICKSIVACWSSQFELEAVTYKIQNGLTFNLPMAVVIQELINCQVAGVAATCNPLTGNKGHLEITANLGLGEGVVAGKQTDTIRVKLLSDGIKSKLNWSADKEEPLEYLSNCDDNNFIEKFIANQEAGCCLSDKQIISLSNILLKVRQINEIKEREIEWGITFDLKQTTTSSSSSSSSSSSNDNNKNNNSEQQFNIHLLQSRPLTNLSRLDLREISHELDYGFGSPIDLVSRANLGEVMPGCTCPTNLTYFIPLCGSSVAEKPFHESHTNKLFSGNSFGFYGQIATMIFSYTDTIMRFSGDERGSEQDLVVKTMIGAIDEELLGIDLNKLDLMKKERSNPNSVVKKINLLDVMALDMGGMKMFELKSKLLANNCKLLRGFPKIDDLIMAHESDNFQSIISKYNNINIRILLKGFIKTLFLRLCTEIEPLKYCWINHVRATILSMAYNIMCMKILSKQAAYPAAALNSAEILHDFSVLIRGGERTESGNTSLLLDELIHCLHEEGSIDEARLMSNKELYDFLSNVDNNNNNNRKSSQLYRDFMNENGHRAYKEFNFSTLVWSDDPSYIIKSLSLRLKQFNVLDLEQKKALEEEKLKSQQVKLEEIFAKITKGKLFLIKYALPRAKSSVARRERTKSFLIKMIDYYRKAFRYLAALLCLDGRLSSVDLIFQLTFEELEMIVNTTGENEKNFDFNFNTNEKCDQADLARLFYKARLRQKRSNIIDQVYFKYPVMTFEDFSKTVNSMIDGDEIGDNLAINTATIINEHENENNVAADDSHLVRGMTSCAGCVTGRAFVVESLDHMDNIEPNDILITYSIDISWTIYFFTLAGIVTEVGGIISHGAVVSREMGIPTLCTAVGACSKFKTGDIVTLDASKGICYLALPPAGVTNDEDNK